MIPYTRPPEFAETAMQTDPRMIRMQQGDVGVQTPNEKEKSDRESTDSDAYKFKHEVKNETTLNCIPYDENDTNLFEKQKTMKT